ncbi:hypothetical protein LV79_003777 [Actinokineospora globicatena]|nr:hypothetical protein [Actinokineospora globicatena]
MLAAFRCSDGVIAISDGRTAFQTRKIDNTIKSCMVESDVKAVILTCGRATVHGEHTIAFIRRTAGAKLRSCVSLQGLCETVSDRLLSIEDEDPSGVSSIGVMVVGYNPGVVHPEYQFFYVHPSGQSDLGNLLELKTLAVEPNLQVESSAAELVRDCFETSVDAYLASLDSATGNYLHEYSLANVPMESAAETLASRLSSLILTNVATFNQDCIGGTWRMYQLGPGRGIHCGTYDWGPYDVDSEKMK